MLTGHITCWSFNTLRETMQMLPRPRNRSDGLSAVKEREENRGESVPVGAGGGFKGDGVSAAVPCSKPANDSSTPKPGNGSSGERGSPVPLSPVALLSPITPLSPCRGGISITSPNSLHRYQSRSPLFRHLSRSSSGYFSFDADSVPSSPLLPRQGVDKATQTPSLSSQVMTHALQRVPESPGEAPGELWRDNHHGCPPSPPVLALHSRNTARDMQAEILIGQELRNIGDQFNRLLMNRQLAGGNGQAVQPNLPPNIHQEPAFLICMSLLLLLVGRVLYLQGINGQPP